MPILGALWTLYRAYTPGATRNRERQVRRFGAFKPTWMPPSYYRAPRTDREAQRMYNHIRTAAFYMDAAPALSDLGLPFRAGLDDIVSLVPLYGDIVSGLLQLYTVFLCWLFGVPIAVLVQMLFNVILDVVLGVVPLIGDVLDNLWKSNLRNLQLLESYLLAESGNRYHILLMPDSAVYLPQAEVNGSDAAGTSSRFKAWFGLTTEPEDVEERDAERATGVVKKTRRMEKNEAGFPFREAPVPQYNVEPYGPPDFLDAQSNTPHESEAATAAAEASFNARPPWADDLGKELKNLERRVRQARERYEARLLES